MFTLSLHIITYLISNIMDYRVHVDYPRYRIYEDGTIIRAERKGKNGNTLQERKIYPVRAKNGYKTVRLVHRDGYIKQLYLHRLVYTAWFGVIPDGYEIDHKDGDRSNNRNNNLRAVPHSLNCKNPKSMERFRTANQLSAGKYNKERLRQACTKEYYQMLVATYHKLETELGHCGIWKLMKVGHCGYPRAKRIIAELEAKHENNQ